MTRIVIALVGLVLLPTVEGRAQEENPWALPAGAVAAPPRVVSPDVAGPIVFTEPEFPLGLHCNDVSLSTLNGTPIGATTTFAYQFQGLPSFDCAIDIGPPAQTFVDPPGIEGGTQDGQLTLDFGMDVTRVSFGFAFSCIPPETPSVIVTAIDSGGGTVGTITVTAVTGGPFVENQVLLVPSSVFRRVRVDFNAPAICTRFLVDNLAYPPLVTPVELQGFTVE
jgi:hypothetical protein